MTHHQSLTRFEQRRRRVRIHRRDLVLFGADPEFMERLEGFEEEAIAKATVLPPVPPEIYTLEQRAQPCLTGFLPIITEGNLSCAWKIQI